METVEGGGIVVLLLSSMASLTQLYGLTMDVHARFRTESHQEVVGESRQLPCRAPLQCCSKEAYSIGRQNQILKYMIMKRIPWGFEVPCRRMQQLMHFLIL